MEIPANECLAEIPVGSGDDNYCTGPAGQGSPIQAHMGELCVERAGDCGTHGSLDNCTSSRPRLNLAQSPGISSDPPLLRSARSLG